MKGKYRIYNYFKNHEGALIALASGITGLVVMVLNFALYVSDRFILSEWNCFLIPKENSPSRFYALCVWFIFFLIINFFSAHIGKIVLEFRDLFSQLNECLNKLKTRKKEIGIKEKKLKNYKSQLKNNKRLIGKVNKNQIDEITWQKLTDSFGNLNAEIQEIDADLKESKVDILTLRSDSIRLKNKLELKIITRLAILSIKYAIPVFVLKYIQSFEFFQSLKSTFDLMLILYVLLFVICIVLLNCFKCRDHNENNSRVVTFDRYSDSAIILSIKSFALSFAFIFIMILFNGKMENNAKRDFDIFLENDQEYASIYESENYLIGEKISFDDNTITFFMDNQIIVEKANRSIVRKKFDKIEKK